VPTCPADLPDPIFLPTFLVEWRDIGRVARNIAPLNGFRTTQRGGDQVRSPGGIRD
jgi:hypothetical protein